MVLANDLLASISAIVYLCLSATRYIRVGDRSLDDDAMDFFVVFLFYCSMVLLRINEFGMR